MEAHDIVSEALKQMAEMARPGVKTREIDEAAEKVIVELSGKPFNKGYHPDWAANPYPTAACISVNSVIVHGIPSEQKLQEGDIVNFDLGVVDENGNCGDAALTVGVGEISKAKSRLLYYAKKTLYEAISHVKAGVSTEEISRAIETFALRRGYRPNRRFGGHAIGKEMHQEPTIYNTTEDDHEYSKLRAGQIVCIEPMITSGNDSIGTTLPDGWTVITSDGKPSAYFEHMILVTEKGYKILTSHFI